MADLKIDYDILSESSGSLQDIYNAFDKLRSRASATSSDWGSDDIASAMGSFSGDWDNHRHKVMKSIESVKQMVDEALQGFNDTETKLSGSLQQSTTHQRLGAAQ
jgi:hypothetical protein